MKNTEHSQLYYPFYFYTILSQKIVFVLLFGIFLLAGNIAHAQLPIFDDFESGFGNWNDGGNDCTQDNNGIINGDGTVRLRDSSNNSLMTSDNINLTAYTSITIEFLYFTDDFENGEDFFVQYNDGTGSGYVNIATYVHGTDFINGNLYSVSLILDTSTYNFVNNARFRIRASASANDDLLYIDDVNIFETPSTTGAPANDDCTNAIVLTSNTPCNPVTGTTVNATQSQTGCEGSANDDVWYSFVATFSSHTISVESITIQNIVFQVFEDNCGGTSLICENTTFASQTESTTLTGLIPGTSYYIRVYSFSSNTSQDGTFSICVTSPPPANDECSGASAERLIPSPVCDPTFGTTIGATETQPGCSGTIADDDVWYFFRATRSQHTIVVDTGTINDIVFEVFVNGCGGTSLLCENSTSGTATETATVVGLNVGTSYRVRVYSASGNVNDRGTFSICVLDLCVPSIELGTDTLVCPSVETGGVGLSGSDVEVNCSGGTTTLEANFLELGDTTDYTVDELDGFNPPYQFECLENPISVNTDDVWSDTILLPFEFCFYGTTYESIVIGSNGVISFDAERLKNQSAGWRITNDIPSSVNSNANSNTIPNPEYFGPSIFGVHHDVDPSKGGEIGWQLITLESGCRALITAWDEVPMYSNNSILYSGMMVLYESTNIIDVYIKEKNIDDGGPWNNGRANLGLQASATEGLTVPGTNISNDWTATNLAYRFTPSGASITTLKWYENGTYKPEFDDASQIDVSPTETTTYIAEVTYDFCVGGPVVETSSSVVTIVGQKTWNGSQDQTWDNPNNWTPSGIPDSDNCITIPATSNDPILTSNTDANGQNITIVDGATLIQEPNSFLTIVDFVNINTDGIYNLQNSASLIQINDDANNVVIGRFNMDRTTNIRANDYVYWSSPVTGFNIENVSSGTPNGYKYQWLPFVNRTPGPPGPLNYGEWQSYNTGPMNAGKGYIIKGPNGHTSTPSQFNATFTGNPNNGVITQNIERSDFTGDNYLYRPYIGGDELQITSDDDNWNLIGNPYPSAINATDFLSLPANSNIDGSVYLWTHGTDISSGNLDSFYEDYTYNYNVGDYLVYNASGPSVQNGFDGNIGAGQGFFVLMNDSESSQESVTFNNSMRSNTYSNNQFYRNSDTEANEKSRIWLDYISPNGGTNTTLIAYVVGATNEVDRMFDAVKSEGAGLNLYSLIDEKAYLIQGRQLPFDDTDRVPIGVNITESGIQTIAINTLQGLFNDANNQIFLEDLENGVIHNLKNSPYTFSSEEGIINERFVLRYTNETLGIDDFDTPSGVKVFDKNEQIIVTSSYESIKSVEVYDILGRTLFSNKVVKSNRIAINTLKPEDRVLLLKITLTDGKQKLAKIIF